MEDEMNDTTKIDTLIIGFGMTAIPLIRELERTGRAYKVVSSGAGSIWDQLAAAGRLDFDLVSSYMSTFYSFELARSKNTVSRYPTSREYHEHIKRYQAEFGANLVDDWVTDVVNHETGSRVHTKSGAVYEARHLVFATAFRRLIHDAVLDYDFAAAKQRTIVLTHIGDSANLVVAKLFANGNRIILVNNGFFCLDKLITERGTRYALDDVEMHNIGNLSTFLYKTVLPQGQILAQSSPKVCKPFFGSNLFIKHPHTLRNLDLTPSLNMGRGSPFTQDLPNGLKIIKYWPIDVYKELFGDALEDSIRSGFLLNDIAYLIDRKLVELWPQQEVFIDRERRVIQWKDQTVQYDDIIDGDQEVPALPPIVIERSGRPSRGYQYFHRDCFMGVVPRDLRNTYMLGYTRPMTGGLNNLSEIQSLFIHKLITDDAFRSDITRNLDERIDTYNREHYPSTLRIGADNLVFYGQYGERIARLMGIESRLKDCRSLEDVSIHYFFPNATCKYRRTGPYAVEGLDEVVRQIHRTHDGYAISRIQLLNYCLMLATTVIALVQLWRTQLVPLPFSVLLLLLLLVFFGPVLPLANVNSNRISGFTNLTMAIGLGLTFWFGHPLIPLGSLAFNFFVIYLGRKLRISRAWFNDMRFKDKPEHDEFFRRYCEAFRKVFDARASERAERP
jgi:hypothetical protein